MRNALLWTLWTLLTLAGAAAVTAAVFIGGDRTTLMTGQTTGVHHQFEASCDSCHTADVFDSPRTVNKELNAACRDCHKDELAHSEDSHPRKKFRDPRMADFWEKLDARDCTVCHIEHKPEITRPGAVTVAMDYCIACHSEGEQDVRKNRPSHANLEFQTCASSGCHNFHDNRALYEDFLVKNAGGPWLQDDAVIAAAAQMRAGPDPIAKIVGDPLTASDIDAPPAVAADFDPVELAEWAASGHAEGGVTCAYCHAPKGAKKADAAAIAVEWSDSPPLKACAKCHRAEATTFTEGRHGMTQHRKLAKPRSLKKEFRALGLKGFEENLPPTLAEWLADDPLPQKMTVAAARLPMKPEAAHLALDCGSCHDVHAVDTTPARVDACAGCHDDDHTQAYFDSPHFATLTAELAGEAAVGAGVGCSDCHMPKIEHEASGKLFTTHNQNAYLRPNEKMIRAVCMDCHSLDFAINALADPALVANNFQGRPAVHIESIEWATRRVTEAAPRQ